MLSLDSLSRLAESCSHVRTLKHWTGIAPAVQHRWQRKNTTKANTFFQKTRKSACHPKTVTFCSRTSNSQNWHQLYKCSWKGNKKILRLKDLVQTKTWLIISIKTKTALAYQCREVSKESNQGRLLSRASPTVQQLQGISLTCMVCFASYICIHPSNLLKKAQ